MSGQHGQTNVVPKDTYYGGSHIIPKDPDYNRDAVDPAKLALRGLHPGPEGNFIPTRKLLGEE